MARDAPCRSTYLLPIRTDRCSPFGCALGPEPIWWAMPPTGSSALRRVEFTLGKALGRVSYRSQFVCLLCLALAPVGRHIVPSLIQFAANFVSILISPQSAGPSSTRTFCQVIECTQMVPHALHRPECAPRSRKALICILGPQ